MSIQDALNGNNDTGEEDARLLLGQQAYEQIRRKIISLELAPGDTIDETRLQEELGLGRTPIREALQRLSLEQLVVTIPRRGRFVTNIELMDLQRIFELRLELEPLAARLAAKRGLPHHWQQMCSLLENLPEADHPDLNQRLIEIDEKFHHVIYDAAENKYLKDTLSRLYALALRLWYLYLPKLKDMRPQIDKDHHHLLDALEAGDAELAGDLLQEHIRAFQEEIRMAMLDMS